MDFSEVLGIVGGVLGILILLGGGLALVRGSYSKATIEALRGDNDDLRKRLTDVEANERRLIDKNDDLEKRYTKIEGENIVLLEAVTQRAEVDRLIALATTLLERSQSTEEKLDEHHSEAMSAWSTIASTLQQIRDK